MHARSRIHKVPQGQCVSVAFALAAFAGLLAIAGCGAKPSEPRMTELAREPAESFVARTSAERSSAPVEETPDNSDPAARAWPLFRGDSLADGVAKSSLPKEPEVLWTFSAKEHGFEATVAIADGMVFAPCLDGEFYALSLDDGSLIWKYHTELGFSAPPSVKDGRVFCGDSDGKFYCFEAATGKPLWGAEATAEINSGPNFYEDKVLFGSQDATLYCYTAADGKLAWKYTIGDQIRCSPTIVEGRAFLAGCDAKLHIIDLDKGEAIATVEIDAPTGSTPAARGDHVYFGTEGASFFCIDWREAKTVWTMKSQRNMPFRSSGALTDKAVIFGARDKQIYALDQRDGSELWKFATRSRVDSSPVLVGNRVFVGSSDGRLYALDANSGEKVWQFEAGGDFLASPAVAANRLVIGNTDGKLYCLGAN